LINQEGKIQTLTSGRKSAPERPIVLEAAGVLVQVLPGNAVIVTVAGNVTVSVHADQPSAHLPLGRTQVTVRMEPR
jgi:hypothetical protein